MQRAVSGQQRQGKQQPTDERAGYIACKAVFAGGQCPFHGQPGSALLKPQALLPVCLLYTSGYDIQLRRGRGGGYWLASRTFELSELKLLVDAVQASKVVRCV